MSVAGETLPPFALSVTVTVVGTTASVRIGRSSHVPAASTADHVELPFGTIETRSFCVCSYRPLCVSGALGSLYTSGLLPRNVTVLSSEHPENASSPRLVTPAGIVKLSISHVANAPTPMLLRLSGSVRLVKGHLKKAVRPMLATPSGIATDSSVRQPLNAEVSIIVTLEGIVTLVSA